MSKLDAFNDATLNKQEQENTQGEFLFFKKLFSFSFSKTITFHKPAPKPSYNHCGCGCNCNCGCGGYPGNEQKPR